MKNGEKRMWNEGLEAMPEQQLKELRMEKLKKQLQYCYDNSEIYKQKFQNAGVLPKDINTWEEFRRMPVYLTKDDERESQEECMKRYGHAYGMHLCCKREEVVGITATSGTTGIPTLSYLNTKQDYETNNEIWARVLWRSGVRPGDVVLHAFGLSMWIVGVPGVVGMLNMGACPVPIGAEVGTERILQIANLTKPSAMTATPSLVEHLIEKALGVIGKTVGDLGIKRIICAWEPGAGLSEFRKKVKENYGAQVFDMMGPAMGIGIISCDADEYQGMHEVTPDKVIWTDDLVDPDTLEPLEVKDGAVGKILVTCLEHQARPWVRFDLGDIYQIFTEQCICGLPGHRLKVMGRKDDMLIVKGVNLYPAAIKNIIETFVPKVTGQFRIILDNPPPKVTPPLRIKIEREKEIVGDELIKLGKEIVERVHISLRVRVEIEFIEPGSLPRTGGKTKYIQIEN